MPFLFGFIDIGNLDENGSFFHASETRVDGSAEHLHGGGEAHVGIDQWRDIDAEFPDFLV